MFGTNCRQCYEEYVVKEYNKLKDNLEKDFIRYIDDWFKQHPNVKSVYMNQKEGWSLYQSISMIPSKLAQETNVKITFK